MPKAKKIRSAALQSQKARHEPLGQVIEGDEIRGKYAAPIRMGRKKRDGAKKDEEEGEYLDPKTSQKILKLTEEQEMEILAEEQQREYSLKNKKHQVRPKGGQPLANLDSDDEEEDEDDEDIVVDEDEEYVSIVCFVLILCCFLTCLTSVTLKMTKVTSI